jgi:hypothetical protein
MIQSGLTYVLPTDSALWGLDRYSDILRVRREGLAACMNEFIRRKGGL